MRPTTFGLKVLAFWATMVLAFYALPYSNPVFLLLGFLTVLGLFGIVDAHRNLRGVRVRVVAPEPIRSGTTARIPVVVSIAGRTRFDLSIRLELASGQKLSAHAAVLREDGKLALESPALARGCYPIERLVVETRHPFGLVVRRSVLPVPSASELVVYPDPGEAFEGRTRARLLQELVAGGEAGAGDLQPSSLRDHRAGDGTRGIHWRASARRGRLVVREWDGESGSGREVVLDRRTSAAALERALATVSALVELAREKKESLRLVSQGLSATFGEVGAPWAAVLRFLAGAEVVPPDGPAPPPASRAALRLPRAPRGVAGVR